MTNTSTDAGVNNLWKQSKYGDAHLTCEKRSGQTMKIKATLEAIYSKRDLNGNVYWSFRYLDHETGKQVNGTISGGESDIHAIIYSLGMEADEVNYSVTMLPIREFNRLTKTWKYFGCPPDEIARNVKSNLEQEAGA